MPETQDERPCLHCMMVELIEDFFCRESGHVWEAGRNRH
jgi:hypothetical protein